MPRNSPDESDLQSPQSLDFESAAPPGRGTDPDAVSIGFEPGLSPTAPLPNLSPPTVVEPGGRRAPPPEPHPPTPAPPSPSLVPGYEVLSTLGRGAMGVVYRARQASLDRTVALKVLSAGTHAAEEERARFNSEALTVARLQHPNVIQVHDVGEHDGVPFLAVEYVDGGNLQQWLGGRPTTVEKAVRLMYAVARGVGAAHAKGIVHRDLKPANILLTADGTPKVADFGLAKQYGAATYTATGALLGTPQYMSPEQAAGLTRRVGPASDVYSLGTILYQCLTGRPPFTATSVLQLLDQVRFGEPVPVRELCRQVPVEVETVCRKCLHKVPEERYRSGDELAEALGRIINGWEADRVRAEAQARENTGAPLLAIGTLVAALLLWALFVWEAGWLPRSAKSPPSTSEQVTTPHQKVLVP
jgi:eukaryotic-like serine/threonine-protein kinase